MPLIVAVILLVGGLLLVVGSAERLVESTVGLSRSAGGSVFLFSVMLIGFDPENLAVGAAANYEQTAGIALGIIVGAAMVAIALALEGTALVVPLEFGDVPRRIVVVFTRPRRGGPGERSRGRRRQLGGLPFQHLRFRRHGPLCAIAGR